MIKAVVFDMYETLVTLWHTNPYMGHEISADAGIPEAKFREIWDATDESRSLGIETYEEVIERILRVNQKYSDDLFHLLVEKRKASKEDCFQHMHEEILPMFDALKNRGIKIGLITNCFSEEREAIRSSCLFPYFDVVCMSCELGLKKPDERIFLKCLDEIALSPEECIYCGDGGSKELEVARSLHMNPVQALWYLKEDAKQPVGRLSEFDGAKHPLDIISMLENE